MEEKKDFIGNDRDGKNEETEEKVKKEEIKKEEAKKEDTQKEDAKKEDTPKSEVNKDLEKKSEDENKALEDKKVKDIGTDENSKSEKETDKNEGVKAEKKGMSEETKKTDNAEISEKDVVEETLEEVNVTKVVNVASSKKVKNIAIIAGSISTVLLIVFFGVLIYIAKSNEIFFDKGTIINGIDVSELTVEKAKDKLKEFENSYQLAISFEDETKIIKGTSINFTCMNDGSVENCLASQNDGGLFFKLLSKGKKSFTSPYSYDEKKLSMLLGDFNELDSALMIAPEDATYYIEDGEYKIKPEVEGNTLDISVVKKVIKKALVNSDKEISMEEYYERPAVYATDTDLNNEVDTLNSLIGIQIVYDMPKSKTKVLDGNTLVKWLSVDEDGNYYKDINRWNKKLTKYVEKLAKKYDTVYEEHKFHTSGDEDVMLPSEGYYGYKIDIEGEVEQLKEDLNNNENVERKPVYEKEEASSYDDNYGFGNSYIEISIEDQHLWVYVDGKVEVETDVVTGTPDGKHYTSTGAFFAYDKQTNKKLTGEIQSNGKPEYEVRVKNWIRITNYGIGIHETSYRSKFGGDIWKTDGSHGCINVPAKIMPEIYKLAYTGMPVAIY